MLKPIMLNVLLNSRCMFAAAVFYCGLHKIQKVKPGLFGFFFQRLSRLNERLPLFFVQLQRLAPRVASKNPKKSKTGLFGIFLQRLSGLNRRFRFSYCPAPAASPSSRFTKIQKVKPGLLGFLLQRLSGLNERLPLFWIVQLQRLAPRVASEKTKKSKTRLFGFFLQRLSGLNRRLHFSLTAKEKNEQLIEFLLGQNKGTTRKRGDDCVAWRPF
ncbi:hypothetical protein LRR81_06450 [Metabacillus sp. GX 13764]|uniref:hypothetical protein n=1 Tax=Metabacillus kandeliae TaxID=2900151 RepID=UPI001E553239|nr:hypothetical protein [Metabacillus kandeliae]MCD7033870.1 hypothetical protein [Metabacillus kandeliae]